MRVVGLKTVQAGQIFIHAGQHDDLPGMSTPYIWHVQFGRKSS